VSDVPARAVEVLVQAAPVVLGLFTVIFVLAVAREVAWGIGWVLGRITRRRR
jgi:hypothetical protein